MACYITLEKTFAFNGSLFAGACGKSDHQNHSSYRMK